jgi:hypothetical protein
MKRNIMEFVIWFAQQVVIGSMQIMYKILFPNGRFCVCC